MLIQGGIKIIDVQGLQFKTLAIFWMGISAVLPWALFLLRPQRGEMALQR
jgi:hypothetical protein